jgi:hypothetical protein
MNNCLDCKKELTGHDKPKRCKKCNQKFIHPEGRTYPRCRDCGKELKTYHSKRCQSCAHKGRLGAQYKDGRTYKKGYIAKYTLCYRNKNIGFRIAGNLRSRIRIALKGICKSKSTVKLLGCSIKYFKNYLKSKFLEGMSWKNYGYYGWHIDHIRPCTTFDLSNPEEQHKCFHYTNLQPLWAKDNLIKSDKYQGLKND